MQPTLLNLALTFAVGVCTAACDGNDNTLIDAPKAPTSAEQAEFEASKVELEEAETPYNDPIPYQLTANGATLESLAREDGKWIARTDYRSLQPGMTTLDGRYTATDTGQSAPATMTTTIRSYQGSRSGITIPYAPEDGKATSADAYGADTPVVGFPAAGQTTYRGVAFNMTEQATLTYHIDFAAKSGHGKIEGLARHDTITLANAPLKEESNPDAGKYIVRGTATSAKGESFDYQIAFYGQQAAEIAGYASNAQKEGVGFHGTRDAITE